MKRFKLKNNLELSIEPYEKKVRLVVYESNAELVCRKERVLVLKRFMDMKSERIFKGRLQLQIEEDEIRIFIKGEDKGSIGLKDFQNEINKVNSQRK